MNQNKVSTKKVKFYKKNAAQRNTSSNYTRTQKVTPKDADNDKPVFKEETKIESSLTVDSMTSKDFHNDIHAHIDVLQHLMGDAYHWNIYRATIAYNKHLFRGRTVLNIGCGIGLLALFAAKAGAAQVFAVDESNAADYALRVVEANNYGHVIKVFKSQVKKITLPVEQIDIILCDWFGYSLLFQSLCAEVIYARDKWLKKDGIIFPDVAKMYIAALRDPQHKYERIDWWYDVYGFTMKPLRAFSLGEPSHQQVHPKQMLSTDYLVYSLNLNTATVKDLQFRSKYMLHILEDGAIDGVFTYFEGRFSKSHTPAWISGHPTRISTRWLQTAYFFDQPLIVRKNVSYCGGFEMRPVIEGRMNQIEVDLELLSGDTQIGLHLERQMHWHLKPVTYLKYAEDEDEQKQVVTDNNNAANGTFLITKDVQVEEDNEGERKIVKAMQVIKLRNNSNDAHDDLNSPPSGEIPLQPNVNDINKNPNNNNNNNHDRNKKNRHNHKNNPFKMNNFRNIKVANNNFNNTLNKDNKIVNNKNNNMDNSNNNNNNNMRTEFKIHNNFNKNRNSKNYPRGKLSHNCFDINQRKRLPIINGGTN